MSRVKVPVLDLIAQHEPIRDDITEAVVRVIRSGQYVLGPEVQAFEREAAAFLGCRHSVGVASGTDALSLLLMAIGIKPGDEVITSPFTFFATAEVIVLFGATPVFVDIDTVTCNMDATKIADRISDRTKAILPIHLYGQSADMEPILDIAAERRIAVICDAAQAFGASRNGTPVCALGDGSAISFYPTKNLSCCGDGGLVGTNRDEIAENVRLLRQHGARERYKHNMLGLNSRLDEIQAAVLRVKLRHLEAWNERRRSYAAIYDDRLAGVVDLPHTAPGNTHIYHQYTIRTPQRDGLRQFLAERGIATGIHYPVPVYLQPALAHLGLREGAFPEAERAGREVLSLPIAPELPREKIEMVAESVREYFETGT